jgi:ribosome-binding factor A
MAKKRVPRLNEQLKRELTGLLQFEVRDPRIGMITVTDVEVSPDLYHARVYYTLLGDEAERQSADEGLRAAAGFLRTELGRRMHIRRAPELHFRFDTTLEHAQHIERLLHQTRQDMTTEPDAEDADAGGSDAAAPDADGAAGREHDES